MPDLGLAANLARHIGQTVTIFTTSGGQSGRGFTGVLASVNCDIARLITDLGSAPSCALGNCCDVRRKKREEKKECPEVDFDTFGRDIPEERDFDEDNFENSRFDCNGNRLGSIVDIPINRIAAFVHNSVGSGW